MSIKVIISPLLQEYYNVPDTLKLKGNTVGECLDDLIRKYPESRGWLFDEDGLLRILISINNIETITLDKKGMDRVLTPDDELQVFAVFGGG